MKIVDPNYLSYILGGITGTADMDEEQPFYDVVQKNRNDELFIKNNIIIPKLKGDFDRSRDEYKMAVKLSLSYYLTKRNIDFERLYNSCLIAADPPDNAVDFFVWIWEIFFPNESYILNDLGEFKEEDDITAVFNKKVGWE